MGRCEVRRFPDDEHYVRIDTPLDGRDVVIVCSLDRPDDKLIPLLFMAATARDLGARRVGLVAPYLAFMRQDKRFCAGEGITSVYFAALISNAVDWLVTVEPHLHRYRSLGEIYSIPSRVVSAMPSIAVWIRDNVDRPVLIGPDAESAQWVLAVASELRAPHIILDKVRRGDREVDVSVPDLGEFPEHTPVLIDDIISTGRTMIEPVGHVLRAGLRAPVCIGVHAIFSGSAFADLCAAGAARVVTCNTVAHESNAIFVDDAVAASVRESLQ